MSVFFDGVGITSSVTTRPFLDMECTWDFDDDDSALWSHGAHVGDGSLLAKKNRAKGMGGAHVYETPGTYTPKVTCTDGTFTTSQTPLASITVIDPNTAFSNSTVCVAATGSDYTGCPVSCATAGNCLTDSSLDTQLATQIAAGKRRILYKGGDTFTGSAAASIGVAGPGYLGAFGTGKPIFKSTGTTIIKLSNPLTEDWRFVDLILDGTGNVTAGIHGARTAKKITVLRAEMFNLNTGFATSASFLNSSNAAIHCTGEFPYNDACTDPIWSEFTLQDSYVHNCGIGTGAGGNCLYMAGTRIAILGNDIEDATAGEHVSRFEWLAHSIISNNYFANPADNKSILTIRAADQAGSNTVPPGSYTEYVIASNNKLVGSALPGNAMANSMPVNDTLDNRNRYLIWERNLFVKGSATNEVLGLTAGSYAVARNNLFDVSAKPSGTVITVSRGGTNSPYPDHAQIYNNTVYAGTAGTGGLTTVRLFAYVTDTIVKNNLTFAPYVTSVPAGWYQITSLMADATASGTVSGGNTVDSMMTADPLFLNGSTTMSLMSDFRPTGSSYAIGGNNACSGAPCSASPVPVFSDFFGSASVAALGWDVGAVRH